MRVDNASLGMIQVSQMAGRQPTFVDTNSPRSTYNQTESFPVQTFDGYRVYRNQVHTERPHDVFGPIHRTHTTTLHQP